MGYVLGFVGGLLFGNGLMVTILDVLWGRPWGIVEMLVGMGLIFLGFSVELNQ